MNERAAETAPAKINLALHVRGRRADGYHELDTLAVFADVGDLVTLSAKTGGPALSISGPFAEALDGTRPEANLVWKAAERMARAAGVGWHGRLTLTKNLPVGAGIGGGSADAAATLRLLRRILSIDDRTMSAIAAELGADVPMCLHSVPLRARGTGERIDALAAFPALPLVLVYPGVPVSTAEVFRRLDTPDDPALPAIPKELNSPAEVAAFLSETRNGLEQAAISVAPAIGEALDWLQSSQECLLARMSGSGSTCFGLYSSEEKAEAAAKAIASAHPDWWVQAIVTQPG